MIAPLALVSLFSLANAESTYDILIPTGAADPNAPFHWSSEKDGDASGFIEIIVGDTVVWKNADTVRHTVSSGSPQKGQSGIFDSGDIPPGQWFSYRFTEVGKFPFYCTLHPWKTGLVNVVSGFSILPNVASNVGDGSKTFDLEYKFNRLLKSATVNENSKTISFTLQGNTNSDDNTLTILLPSELISDIQVVSIDGTNTENFSQEKDNGFTRLVIQKISPSSKEIVITGATIVPEFTEVALIVLMISFTIYFLFSIKQKSFKNKTSQEILELK